MEDKRIFCIYLFIYLFLNSKLNETPKNLNLEHCFYPILFLLAIDVVPLPLVQESPHHL